MPRLRLIAMARRPAVRPRGKDRGSQARAEGRGQGAGSARQWRSRLEQESRAGERGEAGGEAAGTGGGEQAGGEKPRREGKLGERRTKLRSSTDPFGFSYPSLEASCRYRAGARVHRHEAKNTCGPVCSRSLSFDSVSSCRRFAWTSLSHD